ncbi:BON domain-containing protein [bacterium]|nr:BON domain-containing protein [bacterium]
MYQRKSRYLSGFICITLMMSFLMTAPLFGVDEKTLEPIHIINAIETEFLVDDMVVPNKIDLTIKDGIVTMKGQVDHILAKDRAIQIAESVKGVRAVVDMIRVSPRKDREANKIRRDIEHALLLDPATESFDVQVKVNKDGFTTLTGTVQSWAEKELAAKVAKGVRGVTGLKNEIGIDYPKSRSDFDIQKEIEQSLAYDIWVDHHLIDVEVENGIVELSGTVGSAAEKHRARTGAWTYGVHSVNDGALKVEWWAKDSMKKSTQYPHVSDQEIEKALRDALLYDPRIYSFEPEIDVNNGIVTLTGVVDNLSAKRAAEKDAANTVGVWRVKNYLKVRPGQSYLDETVEANIEQAFLTDPVVEAYELDAIVIKGKAFLNGRVEFDFEKEKAEAIAAAQPGVVSMDNDIIVEDAWTFKTDSEIEEDIEDQFFWSLLVNDNIEVEVENGMATLSGTVDSPYEAEAAIDNAFQGGARSVIDNMEVAWGPSNGGLYEWKYYNPGFYPYYGM